MCMSAEAWVKEELNLLWSSASRHLTGARPTAGSQSPTVGDQQRGSDMHTVSQDMLTTNEALRCSHCLQSFSIHPTAA